jgi:hypothetical protein
VGKSFIPPDERGGAGHVSVQDDSELTWLVLFHPRFLS